MTPFEKFKRALREHDIYLVPSKTYGLVMDRGMAVSDGDSEQLRVYALQHDDVPSPVSSVIVRFLGSSDGPFEIFPQSPFGTDRENAALVAFGLENALKKSR